MHGLLHASISSLLFDLRSAQQRHDAKYNNQILTLNHQELNVFSNRPAFVHQQPKIRECKKTQVFSLGLQSIILRTNSLNEKLLVVSLLGASLPFPLL